ncbi:unnamed protein product [Chondrus crispus]|uniref:Uncharacterized protein n=1 Tax=Chondrus crispus TaxID=2769 RepID=R7QAK3_CHOCR|nr:unnamed protein product [Chondrus crispus]CDF34451.1 unnamed protein product [Chondrus crispus]|eukprot:XP_005714270.1 unnamed protein product [Chondrus crispus]
MQDIFSLVRNTSGLVLGGAPIVAHKVDKSHFAINPFRRRGYSPSRDVELTRRAHNGTSILKGYTYIYVVIKCFNRACGGIASRNIPSLQQYCTCTSCLSPMTGRDTSSMAFMSASVTMRAAAYLALPPSSRAMGK